MVELGVQPRGSHPNPSYSDGENGTPPPILQEAFCPCYSNDGRCTSSQVSPLCWSGLFANPSFAVPATHLPVTPPTSDAAEPGGQGTQRAGEWHGGIWVNRRALADLG